MRAAVRARKEQEAASRAIDEARADVGGVAGDSDEDTALPNGFDDILNEICEEARFESDASDEGAWRSGGLTRPHYKYRQVHIAHCTMALKMMRCAAHRRWWGGSR